MLTQELFLFCFVFFFSCAWPKNPELEATRKVALQRHQGGEVPGDGTAASRRRQSVRSAVRPAGRGP